MNKSLSLLLLIPFFLSGCIAATPPPAGTVPASRTPTVPPSPTPTAGRPTRTPAPTPTLPPIPELACIPDDGERVSAVIVGVTDGDTIDVSIGGFRFRVRYLGIDTPETRSPDAGIERMGKEAFNRNLELVRGERVTLINDPDDNDTDPFGRLLRYVVTEDAFVNYRLVREGFSFLYFSGIACGPAFFEAYELAQSEKLGLFAPTPAP
jgi:micrococcal nuclease